MMFNYKSYSEDRIKCLRNQYGIRNLEELLNHIIDFRKQVEKQYLESFDKLDLISSRKYQQSIKQYDSDIKFLKRYVPKCTLSTAYGKFGG